jgi:hypothetical protein
MTNLFNSMAGNGIIANSHIFNILIYAYAKCLMMVEAILVNAGTTLWTSL